MIFLLFAVAINLATRNRFVVYYGLFLALGAITMMMLGIEGTVDQGNYIKMFEEITINNFQESLTDLGYAFLNGFVKIFSNNFWVFLFVINTISMCVLLRFFDRYSPYIAISWALYFILYLGYNIGVLRQGVAITFTILSFRYILSRSVRKYLLCVFIAMTMHFSAILFIPAYWIANKITIDKKKAYILLLLALPLVFVNFLGLFGLMGELVGVPAWQIELYLSQDGEFYERAGLSLGLIARILFFLGFAITCDISDRTQRVLFNIYFAYLLLYFPLSSVSIISARGLDYYKVFECLIIPYAFLNIKDPYWKIGYTTMFFFFFIYSVFNQYSTYYSNGQLPSLLQSLINSF